MVLGCWDNTDSVSALSGIKPQTNPTSAKTGMITSTQVIEAGTYKVGTDIKAGDYVLVSDQAIVAKTIEPIWIYNNIIYESKGFNRDIITLTDGQYFELTTKSCMIYPVDLAPKIVVKNGVLTPGMYKIGTDITAGKYKVDNYAYAEITIYNGNTLRKNQVSYYMFSGSKELSFTDGQIICIKDQSINIAVVTGTKDETLNTVLYKQGDYNLIGTDIKAGEYVLIPDDITNLGYIYFYDYDNLQPEGFYTQSRAYVTFTSGQQINIYRCKVYAPENAPKVEIVDGKLPAGTYKAGVDIPAGTYTIVSRTNIKGRYYVANDSKHIYIKYIDFQGAANVTVKAGQYLYVEDGYIVMN